MDDEATLAALLQEDGGSDDEDDDGGLELDALLMISDGDDSGSEPGSVGELDDDGKGDDEALLAQLLAGDDGSDDDSGDVALSESPTPLASASKEIAAPVLAETEPESTTTNQTSDLNVDINTILGKSCASSSSSSSASDSSDDEAVPAAPPEQTAFSFTSTLVNEVAAKLSAEEPASPAGGLVGLDSPVAHSPRPEQRFELDHSGDIVVNSPDLDAGTPIKVKGFEGFLESPLQSTPENSSSKMSIAQQQQLQREELAAQQTDRLRLDVDEEEEEEEEVKRELLLVISVELTLQVPANADMYVVLSTKRSNTIWNEVGKTDEVQAAQAVAWSKRVPIEITHAKPEDGVKAEIFVRTESGHDVLLVEGETTVAVLDEHHKAEVRGTTAQKTATENYINFCAEVPDPNRIRWEENCSELRRATVVPVEGSPKPLPQVPVALWSIIEDSHVAEMRSTRPHFASEEGTFQNMIAMEIGKEQLDMAKSRLNSGTGELSEFGPHVCLGLFKHFILQLKPSLLCTVYRSTVFRRLTSIRKQVLLKDNEDGKDGASLLSVADLQTVFLRKPTRASALLVWIADRMLDLCGRVSNAHPYLDKVAQVMAPLLYHDAPAGTPVVAFVAAVLRWRNIHRQFVGGSNESNTVHSQYGAIERLVSKEQDKRRRAAAKAVTQQSTASKGSLFKDPKRVVAEDVNSLLKIDSISRLTNKMRALHEDTGGASAGPLEITELKIHQHWIAVGTQHGHIFVFDHFQEFKYRLVGPSAAVKCIDIDTSSHNISFLVASYANAALVLWDIQHNKQLHSYLEKRSLRGYADANQKAIAQAFFLPPLRDTPPQVLAIDVRNCVWVFKYKRFLTKYRVEPLEAIDWPEKSALSIAAVLPPPKCANPVVAQAAVVAVSLFAPKSETLVMLANVKRRFRVDQERPLCRLPIESPKSSQEAVIGVYLAWHWADDQPWPRLAQGYGNRVQIVASRNGEWKMQQEHRTPSPVAAICWLQKDLVLYFTSDHQIAVYNVAEATRMAHLNLAPAASKSSRLNKSGYICGAASGRAKCYFAQVGSGLTLRAMQMRRVDETIQHFRDSNRWTEALSIGVHNWCKQPIALVSRDVADLFKAFLSAKGDQLQEAGAKSVATATKMAEAVVALGLDFCLRFRNYLELLDTMRAWAHDRPVISPLFGRQLLLKLAAHAADASVEVLGVESPSFSDSSSRRGRDPANIQVSARLPALNAPLLAYLLSLFPGGMHRQQIESFLLQVQWGVLGDQQTQVLRDIMAFCLGHSKVPTADPVSVQLPRLLLHCATIASPRGKADYALPLLAFARVLCQGARPVLREHTMLLLHCCLNGLHFPNGPFMQRADAALARQMAMLCLFRPAQAHVAISHSRFSSRLPKAEDEKQFELLSTLLEHERTLGPTVALLRGVFCELWEQQSKGYSDTDLSSGPPLQANDLVSAVCKVVSGWLVPNAAPATANSLVTHRVHPTKRRSMRAVCSLFSELHIRGLLLLRAHGAQPEVPSTSVLVDCLIELASNPRLKALYDKAPREVAIMDLIHRLGQPNRGQIPEHGPGSLGDDRCYATLMREGFHLPAAQYAQLRGCIEDALASYLAMGADAKCVFDFLLGQSKRVMRGANILASRRRKQHGISAEPKASLGQKPQVAPEDQYMYDRLCAAVTTAMAGLVQVDINKTKDIVMKLWGGLTLICIEKLLELHRPRALLKLLQGSTMRNDCDVEQVIHRARQAEAYEVVAWMRWTKGNSVEAEKDLQEGMKNTLQKLRETADAVQNMPAATPGTMKGQLQQLHSHARESVEAIVDVAAQFCKLYWDRSSKSKTKGRGSPAEEAKAKAIFQGVLSKVLNTLTNVDKRLPNTPTPFKRYAQTPAKAPPAHLQDTSSQAVIAGTVTPKRQKRGLFAPSLRVFLHDTTRRILSECQGRMPLHEVLDITLSDAADALKFSEIREMVNDMLQEVKFKQTALESCEEGASQQIYVGRLVRPVATKDIEQQAYDARLFQWEAVRDITFAAEDQSTSIAFLFSQLHENTLQFPGRGMHGLQVAAPRLGLPPSDRGDRPSALPPPQASVTVSFS